MKRSDAPIQQKLMRVILMISGTVLLLTCAAFFAYEYVASREITRDQLATLGKIIAANSTAALAFDNRDDANEILDALRAEKHINKACLYNNDGLLFSKYPAELPDSLFPPPPRTLGYHFQEDYLYGVQPVVQGKKRLGSLYLESDMHLLYDRFRRYAVITVAVVAVAFLLAFLLSKRLQKTITAPILSLVSTARLVSEHHDYAVRATKMAGDELGLLTDAFNQMLTQIETQNGEIRQFNQNLEQKVQERTRELEQAKSELEVVNQKLVKSNRDLEQFAYIASHDLQEPLRKIQIFTGLAEKSVAEEDAAKKYFEKINASARRMQDLIKSVLNYSRLSQHEEQYVNTDLNQLVDNIKTDLELLITEKGAVIEKGQLPVISGIALQLNQLFLNLISNALKFSVGTPVIRITARTLSGAQLNGIGNLDAAGEYVELVFEDNGIGFDQKYAEQIFTIFQRLHDKQTYAGTGIGLALCKKIVESHRGSISAKSTVGKGSAFFVYLPVSQP